MLLTVLLQIVTVPPPDEVADWTSQDFFMTNVMNYILQLKHDYLYNIVDIDMYVSFAMALAGLFTFVWIAVELYPVIAGEARLEVLRILRPFALSIVIMLWTSFLPLFMFLGNAIETQTKRQFDDRVVEVNVLHHQRFQKINEAYSLITQASTYASRAEHYERSENHQQADVPRGSWNPIARLGDKINELGILILGNIKMAIVRVFDTISFVIMNVVIIGILFVQFATLIILAILGPVSFAFSCLRPWRDAWSQWIARFISVSLWSGIAYLMCFCAMSLIRVLLQAEIDHLDSMIAEGMFRLAAWNAVFGYDIFFYPVVCLMTAFGLFGVFPISTWIIQTSGGHAAAAAGLGAAASIVAVGGRKR